ncbi:MAG TPA: flavodoxin family protein [Peptococcaceae bacterium]|nr:MAG: NADPH-dependent FMN reductase [Clostridia bacterium 41_269]HBT20268.1 flavodoxin family protein [Peptococcaceae bacterium]
MLIVAVNGSPRKDGSTSYLLQESLKVARERGLSTEIIHVSEVLEDAEHPFCNYCMEVCTGKCFLGSKLEDAYALLKEADGIIVGTPVYFGTVSAQLKGFWDKTRFMRKEKSLLNTVGGVVTVGGARFGGGQETALNAVIHMMLVQGMTIVGDGYFENDCGHFGSCAQRPSEKDEFALHRAHIIMKRIIEVAEATRELRKR